MLQPAQWPRPVAAFLNERLSRLEAACREAARLDTTVFAAACKRFARSGGTGSLLPTSCGRTSTWSPPGVRLEYGAPGAWPGTSIGRRPPSSLGSRWAGFGRGRDGTGCSPNR